MPIYQLKNVSKSIKVGVWRITETEEELSQQLIDKDITFDNSPNSKNKLRIKQWLATRLLLSSFLDHVIISYDGYGKPHLNNDWNISISHSNEFVAISLNKERNCGIDIEKISQKVERIKHKFLNPIDLKNVTTLKQLTIYWGAKEALYKFYGKKEVLFIENLFIENFSDGKSSFSGRINLNNINIKLPLINEKIEDYILVYTL